MPQQANILLTDVRIQDFRGMKDLCTTMEPLTVLIGENNAGKTTLLHALAVSLGGSLASEDDLAIAVNGARGTRFVIDLRIRPSIGTDFDDGVRARYKGAIQFPDATSSTEYVVLRTIGEMDLSGTVAIERRFVRGWSRFRTEAEALELLERPNSLQLDLVTFFLLDAKRDLVDDLRARRSHWGRLVSELDISAAARSEIEKQLDALSSQIVASSSVLADVSAELKSLCDALTTSVRDVTISPLPGRVEELARGVDVLMKGPAGNALPVRLNGQGARSFAAVLVFKTFVERRVGQTQTFRPLVVAAFEEPEAHLHPQAHRAMLQLITNLKTQTILSTHSPYVVRAVEDIHQIRVVRRRGTGEVTCTDVPRTSGGIPTFTSEQKTLVRRFVLRNNGESLFARLAVIVEGETEDAALPVFAREHWGSDHTSRGVSICKSDGAESGKHIVRLLNTLEIPWVIFADGDNSGAKGVQGIEAALGRQLVVGRELVQLPIGASFERYLLNNGYEVAIECAISDAHGASALEEFRSRLDGQPLSKTETRDYQSIGWRNRLVYDYCRVHRGTFGEDMAVGILRHATASGSAKIPKPCADLFALVEQRLKEGTL